jgi:hypothetical protein
MQVQLLPSRWWTLRAAATLRQMIGNQMSERKGRQAISYEPNTATRRASGHTFYDGDFVKGGTVRHAPRTRPRLGRFLADTRVSAGQAWAKAP